MTCTVWYMHTGVQQCIASYQHRSGSMALLSSIPLPQAFCVDLLLLGRSPARRSHGKTNEQ